MICINLLVCTLALAALAGEASAKDDTRILKAPYPLRDGYTCQVQRDKQSITCDLALYLIAGSRRVVQFNNDDSGRMVIFAGKGSSNDTVVVDTRTLPAAHPLSVISYRIQFEPWFSFCNPFQPG